MLGHRRAFDPGRGADRDAARHAEADAALDAGGPELDPAQVVAVRHHDAADLFVIEPVVGDQKLGARQDVAQLGGVPHRRGVENRVARQQRKQLVLGELLHIDSADAAVGAHAVSLCACYS